MIRPVLKTFVIERERHITEQLMVTIESCGDDGYDELYALDTAYDANDDDWITEDSWVDEEYVADLYIEPKEDSDDWGEHVED